MNPRFLAFGLLLVSLAACDDKNPGFWLPRNLLLAPVALDNQVAYVETKSHTAFLLDPGDPALRPRLVDVGEAPVRAEKRVGQNQLLVLSRGNPGSAAKPPVAAQLQVVDATQVPSPPPLALASRYDKLAQSPDGNYAILYHSSAKANAGDTALFNPNEITIVDFARYTATPRTIRSLGGTPKGIQFSPVLNFHGAGRTLAVVLAQNYVTLLDLTNPGRTEISVPLCPQTTGCSYDLEQIVFGPNPDSDPDPAKDVTKPRVFNLFVRAAHATDIFQITLTELLGTDVPAFPGNDFRATLSLLAVGAIAADMAVFLSQANSPAHADVDTRLVVATPNARGVVVIDPKTTDTTTVRTSIPVNQIIPFVLPVPPTPSPRNQALLVDIAGGSPTATFATLDDLETRGAAALTDLALQAAANRADFLPGQNLVVLTNPTSSGTSALALVDLAGRSASPMSTNTSIASVTFDTTGPGGSRLWGALPDAKLLYLNLTVRTNEPRLYIGTVWLDQPVTYIVPLALPSSDGHRYLVLGHSDPSSVGNITVFDADNPDRATARTAYGFLFSDYLERGQP